ncbi:dicarboxylate/amino acid:cation symporter [Alteromonas sp. 5E99-2]|uniref:dicarboxylate/amino acid:cation symporter n=1 Tax=Alteromonas sp. 5E99-2 TaxID=2817683 RepID=UPI001A97F68C|nr:dicarboxylate/amino acid:cation symporter [Alteromonas sp. 5E99-2]MBO1254946.1 dicarboxylate/amino acid:cation symporter [Alteromonas sp. 5E99-2]
MSNKNKKYSLTLRIFFGMLFGIVFGFIVRALLYDEATQMEHGYSVYSVLVDGVLSTLGSIFISSLKMLVVPLVFVSLICGTGALSEPSKLGRLGVKSVGLYIFTTCIAITLALTVSIFVGPGEGQQALSTQSDFSPNQAPSLSEVVINMFPSNPINALAEGNMLQIIVFAVLFGIAMSMSGEAGKRLNTFFNDVNDVIMKLVTLVMGLAPYGVFVLMAKLFASTGLETITQLLKYFVLLLILLVIHALVTYPTLLKVFTGLSPIILFKKIRNTALFAFSTSSSSATLPITMETARKKLGVGNSVSSFTLPLGATINMDGTAIMQGVATVFIAQVYGVDLTGSDYLLVVLTATLASIGTAGVPGVGLIMLAMVLQQVNLPVEGIALIIGVDRLLDMTRTVVNVTGDCTVACIVAKSEGELNVDVYNDMNAGLEPNKEN